MENDYVTKTRAFGLTPHSSVFQAELQAIRMGCGLVKVTVPTGGDVTFQSDSQAALRALQNIETNSNLVKHTKEDLNNLVETHNITLQWIKAHVNNKGNEIADRAAKTGSKLEPTVEIGYDKAHVKRVIKDELYSAWNRRWQTAGNCRQAFFFHKFVDRSKSKKIMKLSRHDLGILVRYTTGHAHLRRLNKIAGTS